MRCTQGQGRRTDHGSRYSANNPEAHSDQHHRMALGAEVLRALGPGTMSRPTKPGSGPSPDRRRVAGREPRRPRHRRGASTSRTCGSCALRARRRAMSYLLWTPRDRGVRLWAGSRVLASAAIATLRMDAANGRTSTSPRRWTRPSRPRPGDGAGQSPVTAEPGHGAPTTPQTAEILASTCRRESSARDRTSPHHARSTAHG